MKLNAIILIFVFLFERKISNWLTLIRFLALFLGSPEDVPSRVITNKMSKMLFPKFNFLVPWQRCLYLQNAEAKIQKRILKV